MRDDTVIVAVLKVQGLRLSREFDRGCDEQRVHLESEVPELFSVHRLLENDQIPVHHPHFDNCGHSRSPRAVEFLYNFEQAP